ncbi:MAG TPA: hypothetical protein VK787_09035 [Puia sp.]|jgi:hypothetical protein|nr:hypothetical protein [Puia sp.]
MLRVLPKVAFIFNCCFLIACIIRFTPHVLQTEIGSLIIIAGYIIAIILNAALNLYLAVLWILNKSLLRTVPVWLIIINFLFLIAETIYFLHDSQHP